MRWRLAIVLVLLLTLPALAAPDGAMAGTPAELAALKSLREHKLVRLREQARAILRKNPNSIAGHFLMGYSLHHAEGDLPRARYQLRKARNLFIKRYGATPGYSTSPWGWFGQTLAELESVDGEMDLYQQQINVLNEYSELNISLYGREPSQVVASYAWPLMKLGRVKEARARLQQASHFHDEMTQCIYWNTLGALEMEMGHARASYRDFRTLLREIKKNGWTQTCTYLRNAGEAAASLGYFDQAEKYYLKATNYFNPYSFSNPWWDLTNLYLSQGRFPEAVQALKKTHLWSYETEPFLAQQSWAANQHVTCETLLQLGFFDKAVAIARQCVRRPDREGGDSVHRDQWEAGNLLMYRTALLTDERALAEKMTWTSGLAWWKLLYRRAKMRIQARAAGDRATAILATHHRIARSLRYSYAPDTVIVPNWQRPDLVSLYGPGVTEAALQQLYKHPSETIHLEMPYFKVIEAEVQRELGHREQALSLFDQAIATLPQTEVALRARARATAGVLLEQEGHFSQAMADYQVVLDTVPGMFRFLGIRLPLTIPDPGNPTLRKVAAMLGRSPRFRPDSRGFVLTLSTNGVALMATLTSPNGTVDSRSKVAIKNNLDAATRNLVAEIHRNTFAPKLNRSQINLNSLDGSNLSGSTQTNRLKNLFFGPGSGSGPGL